jgi:hypothetical protein
VLRRSSSEGRRTDGVPTGDACWVIRPIEYIGETPSLRTSLFDGDPERRKLAWISALSLMGRDEDQAVINGRVEKARQLIADLNKRYPDS